MPLFTVEQEYYAELEEKKSRFLAFLVPHVDFASRLAELRDEHKKANHHVTAFRRMLPEGRIEEGGKDDGEPAGTSGMPTLKTLIGSDLVDVGVIIVRYFGGTKLGTGGLARAYSGAANLAIREANLYRGCASRPALSPPASPAVPNWNARSYCYSWKSSNAPSPKTA